MLMWHMENVLILNSKKNTGCLLEILTGNFGWEGPYYLHHYDDITLSLAFKDIL